MVEMTLIKLPFLSEAETCSFAATATTNNTFTQARMLKLAAKSFSFSHRRQNLTETFHLIDHFCPPRGCPADCDIRSFLGFWIIFWDEFEEAAVEGNKRTNPSNISWPPWWFFFLSLVDHDYWQEKKQSGATGSYSCLPWSIFCI